MKFWNWFEGNGDKVFNFITLASVMLAKVDGLRAGTSHAILIAGVLATAAHQSFFGSTQPKVSP